MMSEWSEMKAQVRQSLAEAMEETAEQLKRKGSVYPIQATVNQLGIMSALLFLLGETEVNKDA